MPLDEHGEWSAVGERIRVARESRGMSVRELSRRVDVSPGHVSQVERGLASFSVRALYTVANELGISMDSLFEPDRETPATSERAAADGPVPIAEDPLEGNGVILRVANRPTLQLSDGPRWERLTAKPEPASEFLEVVYAPAPGAEPPTDLVRHIGREYGLIVVGELHVQVGFNRAVLRQGDTIAFDSSIPHRFWNSSADEVRAIWFVLDRIGNEATGGDLPTAGAASHR